MAVPALDSWASPAGIPPTGDGAMKAVFEAAVPYFGCLYEIVTPLRGDSLTERDWKTATAMLDTRPAPDETDGIAWTHRWVEFVGAVWALHDGAARRAEKAAKARRVAAKRPATVTAVRWEDLL